MSGNGSGLLSCDQLIFFIDQERISSYNINAISSRQVMRIKKIYQLWDYYLIQHQILQSNIIRIVCQAIRRINYEIIRMKGLRKKFSHLNLMPQNLMGINLIANSLKHCYLASQSNLSMNQILSHLLLAASFSFRFSFLFSFLFCRYVSHGVICLLSFSFNLLVTRSSVVS